jgi:WD40 repeat protein
VNPRECIQLTLANFQTHPQFHNPPTTVYLSPDHTFALWGQDGHLIHTALGHKSANNRAQSVNTYCNPADAHHGDILDISSDGERFITAGTDGYKHWEYTTTLSCLYTSPNPAVLARCTGSTICALSNGQLHVQNPDLCIDIDPGPYASLHLDRSVFITRRLCPTIERIDLDGTRHIYSTPNNSPLSAVSFPPPSSMATSRIIVAGDIYGWIWIWTDSIVQGFHAMDRKITAITYNSSLLAVASTDTAVKLFDPYTMDLVRSFRLQHLSSRDLALADSDDPDARYVTVNQLLFENDLLIASVGRQVYGWRATRKVKDKPQNRKLSRKSHKAISEPDDEPMTSRSERQQWAKMDKMGLDSEDAMQYAMMLSMESLQSPEDAELRDIIEAISVSEHIQ